ncbi:hypothetical protein FRC11_009175, partial [Ceratobasidium sp. 423]
MSRRRSLIPSRVDILWNEDEPSEESFRSCAQFVGGVYAYQSQKRSSDGRRRTALEVVKLPSLNRGTDITRWTIYDEKLDKYDPEEPAAWIYPDRDLLVLLEGVTDHEDATSTSDHSSTGGSKETVLGYYFHLRTLSTNVTHPDVCQPLLHLIHDITPGNATPDVQLQGPLMLAKLHYQDRYVVWDWASGTVVFDDGATNIEYIDIRLHGTLLIAIRPTKNKSGSSSWFQLPSLDVYSLCSNNLSMLHVARMELPEASWEGMRLPFSELGCTQKPDGIGLLFKTEMGFPPSFVGPVGHTPGVFEVPSSARLLEMTVFLRSTSTGLPHYNLPEYSLSIPISSILHTQQILQSSTGLSATKLNAYVVPWDEWGNKVHWTISGFGWAQDAQQVRSWVFGPRGIIAQIHGLSYNGDRDIPSRGTISVIEFHPGLHAYSQFSSDEDNARTANRWANGKLHLRSNYLVTKFEHNILDKLRFVPAPAVWMGDEHMIILE